MDFGKLCELSGQLDQTMVEIDRFEKIIDDYYRSFLPMEQKLSELREKAEKIKLEMTSMISAYCDSKEEEGRHGNAP